MVIKIKLKGLNSISLLKLTCSKSTPKPCSNNGFNNGFWKVKSKI